MSVLARRLACSTLEVAGEREGGGTLSAYICSAFFHIHEISFPQLRGAATSLRVCHQGVQDDTQ